MHHFTGTAEQRGKSNERGMCQKGARRKEGRAIYYYTDDKTNPNAETSPCSESELLVTRKDDAENIL